MRANYSHTVWACVGEGSITSCGSFPNGEKNISVCFEAIPKQSSFAFNPGVTVDGVSTPSLFDFSVIYFLDENGNSYPDSSERHEKVVVTGVIYSSRSPVNNTGYNDWRIIFTYWLDELPEDLFEDDDDPPWGDETNDIIWTDGCECGACCQCRCECGKWNMLEQGSCVGHSANNCTNPDGCNAVHQPHPDTGEYVQYHHCGCHDVPPDEDDDDEEDDEEGTNQKREYDFDPPEHVQLEPPTTGPPSFAGPSEIEKPPLQFFNRNGDGFPEFKYDELFDDLSSTFSEKIPMDWLKRFSLGSDSGIDLKWRIDLALLGVRIGPHTFDLRQYINDFAAMQIARVIRLILLFIVVILFLLAVFDLLFGSA